MRRPPVSAGPGTVTTGNRLLDALALAFDELRAYGFRYVTLQRQELLYAPGTIEHAYFPVDAVCSTRVAVDSGAAIETHSVGREGVLGAQMALGAAQSASSAFCQLAGGAFRVARDELLAALARSAPLRDAVERYTVFQIAALEHAVACNRAHHLEDRCARWLLTTLDRAGRATFLLTHDDLASMFGVQRAGVTLTIGALERTGAIRHTRGSITVVDRDALERRSCACYGLMRAEYARLFPAFG